MKKSKIILILCFTALLLSVYSCSYEEETSNPVISQNTSDSAGIVAGQNVLEESFIEKSNSDMDIQSQTVSESISKSQSESTSKAQTESKVKTESESVSITESESKPDTDIVSNNSLVFTPHNLTKGWLYELSGGDVLEVFVAYDETLYDQKYIDIKGKNGHVRYYLNSFKADELNLKNTVSQFWSAKQKVGDSIKKDFSGEIKTVLLFEKPDGSKYLYGYVESDKNAISFSDLPTTDYFSFNEPKN